MWQMCLQASISHCGVSPASWDVKVVRKNPDPFRPCWLWPLWPRLWTHRDQSDQSDCCGSCSHLVKVLLCRTSCYVISPKTWADSSNLSWQSLQLLIAPWSAMAIFRWPMFHVQLRLWYALIILLSDMSLLLPISVFKKSRTMRTSKILQRSSKIMANRPVLFLFLGYHR